MAEDKSETIWKAVRAKLLADPSIVAALGAASSSKVVRRAIPGDALPCIICTSLESTDRGTDTTDAETIRLELHIWSKADDITGGAARGAVLKNLVKATLHWADIGTRCTVERAFGPLADPQNDLHHFVVVVEAISEHTDL